jgi:hypothetical protein
MQNITKFFDTATRRDFSRDFLFRVQDIKFGDFGEGFDELDLVYAISASLPARTINNIEVPYRGLTFNVPGSVKYGNSAAYKIKFYCDAESNLYSKFVRESRRVFQDVAGPTNGPRNMDVAQGTTGDYRIAGLDAVITLQQLDKRLEAMRIINLIGVSIREVGALEYTMAEGKGDVIKFDVDLAYHYYTDEETPTTVDSGLTKGGISDGGGAGTRADSAN